MSTDQRAREIELRAKLLKDMESRKGFRRDMIDAVTKNEWDNEWDDIILTALADAERGVWQQVIEKAQQASNDSASPEWILEWAKAQAREGASHE